MSARIKMMIDPPEGWRYGFPKTLPPEYVYWTDEETDIWLISEGYPKHLVDQGLTKYCRYIEIP